MLPFEITQGTPSQKLTQEFLEKILTEASDRNLLEFIKCLKDANAEDSNTHAGVDSLMLSPKTAEELTGFLNKIAENLDKLFYEDCQPDRFLPLFNKDIELATKRLESGSDLRPEQRLELQPSAYSGFDDKFSQQDFANILFVMAMANYASNKSQGKIEEDKFIDVLKSMDEQSAKQQEELSREPRFQAVIPYQNLFFSLTCALNLLVAVVGIASLSEIDRNEQKINYAKYFIDYLETQNKSQTDKISELAKNNLTAPEFAEMTNRNNAMKTTGFIGFSEAIIRTILSGAVGYYSNSNTNFLLFATSLIFASETLAELIGDKNLVKTFFNTDEPTSVDNRLLVDGLGIAILFASRFNRNLRIDKISDQIIGSASSLAVGVINCVKSLSKSRAVQDLESGLPLIENTTISPDQIKELAKEFTKLLAISTPTPELKASTSTPPQEVRVSRSASAGDKQTIQQYI